MLKLNTTERILFLLSAICFCVFSYLLYDDTLFFPPEAPPNHEKIGELIKSANDVRRKAAESFVWRPAEKKDSLFLQDSIFTGNDSQAELQLSDGSVIHLKENTMITLSRNSGQLELDLKYGDLTTNLAPAANLQLKSNDESIDLQPTGANKSSIQIQKARSTRLKLKLLDGEASLTDKNKQKLVLSTEKALLIAPKQEKPVEVVKPVLNLKTADQARFFLIEKKQSLQLQWESKGLSRVRIEVSKVSDFATSEFTTTTVENSLSLTGDLGGGWYFWRGQGLDAENKVIIQSPPRRFQVELAQAPVITQPAPGSVSNFQVAPPIESFKTSVELKWSSPSKYSAFEWEIITGEDFSRPLLKGTAQKTSVLLNGFTAGTYSARIRGVTEEKALGPWSTASTWTLQVGEKKLAAPELLTKAIVFNPSEAQRNPASLQAPQIQWKKVEEAKLYRVELSENREFNSPTRVETKSLETLWEKYRPGVNYFRVQAENQENLRSPFSEVGSVRVVLNQPIIEPVSALVEQSEDPKSIPPVKNVELKWTTIPMAQKYLFQMDRDPQFKNPEQAEISSTNNKIILRQPGSYNVRVRGLDSRSRPITEFSPVEKVNYDFRVRLLAPQLASPENEFTIFQQQDLAPFQWMTWSPVRNAIQYEIELAVDAEFQRIIHRDSTKTPRYLLKRKVPYVPLYWRVRALAAQAPQNSDWSQPRVFQLIFKRNENNFQ